jgi:hypothetical protein
MKTLATGPELTPNGASLQAAIAGRRIDEIRIAIVPGGFVWKLFSGSEEIYAGPARGDQVAGMLQATEILVNTELGIPSTQLVRGPRRALEQPRCPDR